MTAPTPTTPAVPQTDTSATQVMITGFRGTPAGRVRRIEVAWEEGFHWLLTWAPRRKS
jgi:hypothetical protein